MFCEVLAQIQISRGALLSQSGCHLDLSLKCVLNFSAHFATPRRGSRHFFPAFHRFLLISMETWEFQEALTRCLEKGRRNRQEGLTMLGNLKERLKELNLELTPALAKSLEMSMVRLPLVQGPVGL